MDIYVKIYLIYIFSLFILFSIMTLSYTLILPMTSQIRTHK